MTGYRPFSGGLCDNKNVEERLQKCRVFGGGKVSGGAENGEGKGFGWRGILDKDVFNDANENIGTIEDLIVTRDKGIFDAIIGVGVFLGWKSRCRYPCRSLQKHKQAHPPSWCKQRSGQSGAEFKYADELFFLLGPSCLYRRKGACQKKLEIFCRHFLRRVPFTVVDEKSRFFVKVMDHFTLIA